MGCRGLRALIVLDDVWIAQDLEPFAPLRGGAPVVMQRDSTFLLTLQTSTVYEQRLLFG